MKRKDGKKANRKGTNTGTRDLNAILNKRKCIGIFFLQRIPFQNFFRCSFPLQYFSMTQLAVLFLFDSNVYFLYALRCGVHGM